MTSCVCGSARNDIDERGKEFVAGEFHGASDKTTIGIAEEPGARYRCVMKRLREFIKTTLISGMFVLFPLFATVYFGFLVLSYLVEPIKPIVLNLFPGSLSVGTAFVDTLSILLGFGLCFLAGLITRSLIGRTLAYRLDLFLSVFPGYRMFARIARIVFDRTDDSGTPVVVARSDSRQIGFMMEEGVEEVVIFFPQAPSLISGTVEAINASAVKKLNVSAARVARVIGSYGVGLETLLSELSNDESAENLKLPENGAKAYDDVRVNT